MPIIGSRAAGSAGAFGGVGGGAKINDPVSFHYLVIGGGGGGAGGPPGTSDNSGGGGAGGVRS